MKTKGEFYVWGNFNKQMYEILLRFLATTSDSMVAINKASYLACGGADASIRFNS